MSKKKTSGRVLAYQRAAQYVRKVPALVRRYGSRAMNGKFQKALKVHEYMVAFILRRAADEGLIELHNVAGRRFITINGQSFGKDDVVIHAPVERCIREVAEKGDRLFAEAVGGPGVIVFEDDPRQASRPSRFARIAPPERSSGMSCTAGMCAEIAA